MRVSERKGGQVERQLLIGMIVNPIVLSKVSSRWESNLFGSKWANVIGGWCVKYYQKYGKPPGRSIETLFENWQSDRDRDPETVGLMDRFLVGLDEQYSAYRKGINPEYLIDQASPHFTQSKLRILHEKLGEALELSDVEGAEKLVQEFRKVEIGLGSGIDVLQDKEALKRAFEEKADPLIELPDAIGEFFGDTFERDGFVSFEGPEKRGKSWWLFHIAWVAMLGKRKVALFSVGDMSEAQVNRRLAIRASHRPLKPKTILYPKAIRRTEEGDEDEENAAVVTHDERRFTKPLGFNTAWKAYKHRSKMSRTDVPLLKLSTHANSSLSMDGVRGVLDTWATDGWVPDFVIIDYAELLAPRNPREDKIDQIDDTWRQMPRLSQELHCCVVTATQTNAASYKARTIGMEHFSGNKAKRAHPTAVIGLGQTEPEKAKGVYRLNYVARREEESLRSRCVHVAGCLAIGNPAIRSTW